MNIVIISSSFFEDVVVSIFDVVVSWALADFAALDVLSAVVADLSLVFEIDPVVPSLPAHY